MSKNQFEQLIEYVINDEDAKAKELFHQIVVSKSRQIYENLMQEGENDMGLTPDEVDTNMSEGDDMMGGSQSGDMINDVEAEEQGMHEGEDDDAEFDDEAEDDGEDLTHDMEQDHDEMGGDEPATKGDVMDLADKLDELMAEFEHMMGGDDMGGDDMDNMGGDGMDDMEIDTDEFETEGRGMGGMMENITLKQVHPKTTTHEEGDGKAGPVAFNSGQTGMEGRPVKAGQAEGGHHDTAAYKNSTKDLIGKVGNSPAQAKQDLRPATKPHLGQASGVNTRTPFPRSGK
jgi:hypothetical protein